MTKKMKCGLFIVVFAGSLHKENALAQVIELTPVVARPVSRKLDLPGELQPFLSVVLTSRVAGYVEKVFVDRGSKVKQGDLLVELSAPELKAHVAEADSKVQVSEAERLQAEAKLNSFVAGMASLQATLSSAQATYDRLRAASQTPGAISGNELEIALRAVEAQRAGVEAQKANVEAQRSSIEALRNQKIAAEAAVQALREMETYLRVTAPFDGVVTERLVHPGAVVGPNSNAGLAVVQQVDPLRLVVPVPEASVGGIIKGVAVEFQVPAHPERTYVATIARFAQSLDQKTRTMPVELDVNNKDGSLAPGMYSKVQWPVGGQAALYVPQTSVVTTTERTFVIRDRSGKAEWVDVRKGPKDGDLIQIIGPLRAGDSIVKRATDELREGSPLRGSK